MARHAQPCSLHELCAHLERRLQGDRLPASSFPQHGAQPKRRREGPPGNKQTPRLPSASREDPAGPDFMGAIRSAWKSPSWTEMCPGVQCLRLFSLPSSSTQTLVPKRAHKTLKRDPPSLSAGSLLSTSRPRAALRRLPGRQTSAANSVRLSACSQEAANEGVNQSFETPNELSTAAPGRGL